MSFYRKIIKSKDGHGHPAILIDLDRKRLICDSD